MSNIREYAKTIIGRDLTNGEVQAILAKHQALGLKETDIETAMLDTVLLEIMVLQSIPAKIKASMDSVEQAAASRLTAAASEIVKQSSGKLVDTFRSDYAAMTWKRAVWAGLVLLVLGIGSWCAGEVDVWWHNHELSSIEAKLKVEKAKLATDRVVDAAISAPFDMCGGQPCVPIAKGKPWHLASGPNKGTPLAILDMSIINGWQKKYGGNHG